MKYRLKTDGTMRATLWIRIDLQKSDIDQLRERAKKEDMSIHSLLGVCLYDGIQDMWDEECPGIITDEDDQ